MSNFTDTLITLISSLINYMISLVAPFYSKYIHKCLINPSFNTCKFLVIMTLFSIVSFIYKTIQSTDTLKDENIKHCPYKRPINNQDSSDLNIKCNSRFKMPKRTFLCRLHKNIFGTECKSFLEQKLLYDKDIHDYENEGYDKININSLKRDTPAYDNSNWNSPYRSDTDIFGFKVK